MLWTVWIDDETHFVFAGSEETAIAKALRDYHHEVMVKARRFKIWHLFGIG